MISPILAEERLEVLDLNDVRGIKVRGAEQESADFDAMGRDGAIGPPDFARQALDNV